MNLALDHAKGVGTTLAVGVPEMLLPAAGQAALDAALQLVSDGALAPWVLEALPCAAIVPQGRLTVICCHLPFELPSSTEWPSPESTAVWGHTWQPLSLMADGAFYKTQLPVKRVLQRLRVLSRSQSDWSSHVLRLDELSSVRDAQGDLLTSSATLGAEEAPVSQAATLEGLTASTGSGRVYLIRTTETAMQALRHIHDSLLTPDGLLVERAHLSLDVEGPLRRTGRAYLIKIATRENVTPTDAHTM